MVIKYLSTFYILIITLLAYGMSPLNSLLLRFLFMYNLCIMKKIKWHGIYLNVPANKKDWIIIGLLEAIIILVILGFIIIVK